MPAGGIPVCVVPYGRNQLEAAARDIQKRVATDLLHEWLSVVDWDDRFA